MGQLFLPLKPYVTFRIGGNARIVSAYNSYELANLASSEKSIVLGKGSNVLVSDNGVSELVVLNRTSEISLEGDVVACDSGVGLAALASYFCEHSYAGLEWAAGIPGTVGGALITNAGAYGGEIADILQGAVVVRDGKYKYLPREQCGLTYRSSSFEARDIILKAYFGVSLLARDKILERMSECRRLRRASQPFGFSAGSIFKKCNDISSGYYIDKANLKGFRVGGAYVSPKHANFIINDNFASSQDVRLIIDTVKGIVFDKFDIKLEEEIKYIGDY